MKEMERIIKGLQLFQSNLVLLITGLIVGFCMTLMLSFLKLKHCNRQYDVDINNTQLNNSILINANVSGTLVDSQTEFHENSSVAQKLYNEVRVLCWIMTQPNNSKKALSVKRTWGRRCNKLIFMSSAEDEELDAVALNVTEDRPHAWGKTKEAFKYIYAHHMDEADWFLKADDDTYIVVENLRYLLYPYSSETPIYFGCRFKHYVKQGYMSGGAGYVLSKEAVRRFVVEAIPQPKLCTVSDNGVEDLEIGKCLEKVHVIAGSSIDSEGRGRFFPLPPDFALLEPVDMDFWYWNILYYKPNEGMDCCSDKAISFHYITPNLMFIMEYLIQFLQTYGIRDAIEELPKKLEVGEIMPTPVFSGDNSSSDLV